MSTELRFTASHWDQLHAHLLSDGDEHAALLVCGHQAVPGGAVLLVRSVIALTSDDLEQGSGRFHLRVSPAAVARAAKAAKLAGGTVVLCHSHPFPGPVRASMIDLETEQDLCGRALASRLDPRPTGAFILGPDGFDGRLWAHGKCKDLNRVRIVGDRVTVMPAPIAHADDAVARQVLAWSAGGQARLAQARVAVVGVGGTGSHVATQLAHLRIGSLLLIDHDHVEPSNLSRILGATPSDVGRAKVDVVGEAVRAIHPTLKVDLVAHSVLDIDAAAQLAAADLIVCCTDGHGSRALLTELCAQFLVPVIDLGVEVQPREPEARVGGGVRVLRPGEWCLHCARTLDPALVREEFLSEEDLKTERGRGYIRGASAPNPSVIALNGVVASLAVLEVCALLAGFLPPMDSRVLYIGDERRIARSAVAKVPGCFVCGDGGLLALGDARVLPRRLARGHAA